MLHHDTNAKSTTQQYVEQITAPSIVAPYFSELLEVRSQPGKGGKGVFARAAIDPDVTLVVWDGTILDRAALLQLPYPQQQLTIQIEDDAYLVSFEVTAGDYVNHSCKPNARLDGDRTLIALRGIAAGEEVCFDYATCDADSYDEFDCACGTNECRGHVSGRDWRDPRLQVRYDGMFSPYLQRRIAGLR